MGRDVAYFRRFGCQELQKRTTPAVADAIGCGRANWAGIVPLVDLGRNRLGCCDDSRPDRRFVAL
jgi:hypothetical protein